MIQVNLLPWREESRQQKRKLFYMELMLAGIAALIIAVMIHIIIGIQYSTQLSRNQFLSEKITTVSTDLNKDKALDAEKDQLIHNLHLIQDLHNSRFRIVGILEDFVRLLPPKIYLTEISAKDGIFNISGTATSSDDITTLAKNFEQSQWLSEPNIKEIRLDPKDNNSRNFDLVVLEKASSLLLANQLKDVSPNVK